MNMHSSIPKKWQFDFLRGSVPKRKRFSKWIKKDSTDVSQIMEYYKYSARRALEVLPLLSSEQLEHIKEETKKGGR